MASIAACPRCTSNLKIPIGSFAESEMRCPVCGAEFLVSEAPIQALPEATIIASKPKPTPEPEMPSQPVEENRSEPIIQQQEITAEVLPTQTLDDSVEEPAETSSEPAEPKPAEPTPANVEADSDPLASLRAKLNNSETTKPSATLSSFLNERTEQAEKSQQLATEKRVDPLLSLNRSQPEEEKPEPATFETSDSEKTQPIEQTESTTSLEDLLSSWTSEQENTVASVQREEATTQQPQIPDREQTEEFRAEPSTSKQVAKKPRFDDLLLGASDADQHEQTQIDSASQPLQPNSFDQTLAQTVSSLEAEREASEASEAQQTQEAPATKQSLAASRWVKDLVGQETQQTSQAVGLAESQTAEAYQQDSIDFSSDSSSRPAFSGPIVTGPTTAGPTDTEFVESVTTTQNQPAASLDELDLKVKGRLMKPQQRRGYAKVAAGTLGACLLGAYGLLWAAPQADLLRMGDWAPQAILPSALRSNGADPLLAEGAPAAEPNTEPFTGTDETLAPTLPGAAQLLADRNSSAPQPLPPRVEMPAETPLRQDPAVAPASATEPVVSSPMHSTEAPTQNPITLIATRNDQLKALLRNPRTVPPATLAETLAQSQISAAEFLSLTLTDRASIGRKGQDYMTLCNLAEQVALLDPTDPAADYGSLLADCKAVFESVMTDPANRNELAQIAARWNEHVDRPNSGMVMVGTVKSIEPAGGTLAQYQLEVDWGTDRAVIPVLMPRLRYTTGDRVGVTGLVVDQPQQHLEGYEGDTPQVVVADYTFTPQQ